MLVLMKNKILFTCSVLTVFYIFWLWGVPNIAQVLAPKIISRVVADTNYQVKHSDLRFRTSFLPYCKIKAEDITVVNPLQTTIVSLKSPEVKVSLLPLFVGKIRLSNVSINDFNFSLYLDEPILKDEKVVEFFKHVTLDSNSLSLKHFYLKLAQAQLVDGAILQGDNLYFSNKRGNKIFICDSTVRMAGKTIPFKADLYIPSNIRSDKTKTNLLLKDFDISLIYSYFNKFLPKDLKSLSGIINLEIKDGLAAAEFLGVKIGFNDAFKTIQFPSRLVCNSEFSMSEKDISLQAFRLKGDGIDINSAVLLKNLSKTPLVNIKAGLQDTKSEVLIKMLPPLNTSGVNLLNLKKTPLFADVSGYLSINGNLKAPEIVGDFLVKNAYMISPFLNAKKPTEARITLKNDKVFYDVEVGTGGNELVKVSGETEIYNENISKIEIKSTPSVNLAVVHPIVCALEKIFYFNAGPISIMDIKGLGSADFKIEGSMKNPHAWGELVFKNSTASFKDIKGLLLTDANGRVGFNNQDVSFEFPNAKMNANPISIIGKGDLFGKLSVDVDTSNIDLGLFVSAIKSSSMLKEFQSILPPVDKILGRADLKLSLKGNLPSIDLLELNKNLFASGLLRLHNVTAAKDDYQISNINGIINFTPNNLDLNLESLMSDSKVTVKGSVKNNIADLKVVSPKLNLKDILVKSALSGVIDNNFINFKADYKGKLNDFEFDKLNFVANVLPSFNNSPVVVSSGVLKAKNGIYTVENVKGLITQNPFVMSAKVYNLGEKNQNINANIDLKNASLSTINLIREFYLIPKETKELLRKLDFQSGKTDIALKVTNNKPYSKVALKDVTIKYLPLDMPIKIINGELSLKNNVVLFSKINTLADDMPIFIDGQVSDIYKRPYHNMYINSVPKQSFIDKYINKNSLYPLKVKGDIIYSAKIKGWLDLYNIVATAKIGERASLYYLGATVGDAENSTVIDFDGDIVKNNSVKINNFEYNKVVSSLNNKQNIVNFLKMKGGVKLVDNVPVFHDFIIKTENPTDARIFNVIFKKPNIKQGLFTSDLKLSGKLTDLKILGDFNIYEIDLPLLQTVLKSVALKFTNSDINIDSNGEVFSNDIKFKAVAKNSLKTPFIIKNGEIHFDNLDLNAVISDLKKLEINKPKQNSNEKNQDIDLATVEIERLDLTADTVLIKGVVAHNLKSIIALSKKMVLSLSNYSMNLANGSLSGDFNYNLLSKKADLLLNAQDIDANKLSIMLFDLSNQIYGALTGTVSLACNATNDTTCASSLYGNASFNVKDGRMPKLGSLEYLLKAGNLLKGGITGLSINSLVDIITPLKTGEFTDILGTISIQDGIADDIKITTRGKDLNLYMKGDLNIATSDARMFVFGMLSRRIKTPLGAVGNLSLNTLFNLIPGVDLETESSLLSDINKIPGIELSQKAYRKFMAEIRGDISGENYVKSFKWIN